MADVKWATISPCKIQEKVVRFPNFPIIVGELEISIIYKEFHCMEALKKDLCACHRIVAIIFNIVQEKSPPFESFRYMKKNFKIMLIFSFEFS
jgi:hypothetical protein